MGPDAGGELGADPKAVARRDNVGDYRGGRVPKLYEPQDRWQDGVSGLGRHCSLLRGRAIFSHIPNLNQLVTIEHDM